MNAQREHIKALLAINVAAIIFGSAALYGKLDLSPFWIVSMRGLFASISLLGFGIIRKQIQIPGKTHVVKLVVTGSALALHWLTFFFSVQVSGVAVATLTFSAFPIFTLIIEALKNNRIPTVVEIVAGTMIIMAVVVLVKVDATGRDITLGSLSGLASALLFAVFGIMSKKITTQVSTVTTSISQNLVVAIILLPALPFTARYPDESIEWLFVVMLGVITTALMHQLYFYALQRLTASACSGFVALEPVYAILFAAMFFSEPVTVKVIISGVLILLASFLLVYHERRSAGVYNFV